MPLDSRQREKLEGWLARKAQRFECPVCKAQDDWEPGDIVAAPIIKPGGLHVGDCMLPMVQIICNNCSHVTLLAAEPVGIYY